MYLGFDLGTSGLKGVIVDDKGYIVASHNAHISLSRPHPGWSEQDPNQWIDAAKEVLRALQPQLGAVKAIGLSGQMHGATTLDAQGSVIRPAILWNDTRAGAEADALSAKDDLRAIFGNITFAGFTAPKIVWMRQHEPTAYKRIAKVLLPKDYIRFWLTGEYVSEMSDASGTAWLDIGARAWSDKLLAASGLNQEQMPRLVEGSEASGQLRDAIATDYGLPKGVVVAGGAGDNAASAIGLGLLETSKGFVSLGTSGVVFSVNAEFSPNPESALHAFCHAVPSTWHQMGVTLAATDSLNWLANLFGTEATTLVDELGSEITPNAEIFMPFLGGERTPYNSTQLRGSFQYLGHQSDRQALTRAVLEGVCFSLKECLDLMEQGGETVKQLYAVGGGAQSSYWLRVLATILKRPLLCPLGAENAASVGAARLGALAAGQDFPVNEGAHTVTPVAAHEAHYAEKYDCYKYKVSLETTAIKEKGVLLEH